MNSLILPSQRNFSKVSILTSGDSDVDSTFEFCVKSKLRLMPAGVDPRKFVTNSQEMRTRTEVNEKTGFKKRRFSARKE